MTDVMYRRPEVKLQANEVHVEGTDALVNLHNHMLPYYLSGPSSGFLKSKISESSHLISDSPRRMPRFEVLKKVRS
jgi:hypothetical protein